MKYMLLIYSNPANWAALPEAEQGGLMGEYGAFTKEITESGEFVSGDPLSDTSTASTVRVRAGSTDVNDGPFIESKEHMGGYLLVECDSLERATEIAARLPEAQYDPIEVRRIMDRVEFGMEAQ